MTISEVAKLAGVSNAAVSRYLNDGYVSEEKKNAIRKAIEETGYKPSAHAQMLRTKRTKLIGVVLPKINSHSTSRTVSGINKVLCEHGFQILLADTENSTDRELEYLKLFQNQQVDGIILIATIISKAHKEILKAAKVPVVVVGQEVKEASCIFNNDFEAAKAVAEVLLKRGRKKLAYLGVTNRDKAVGMDRYRGFCTVLQENGLPEDGVFREECGFTLEEGEAKAKKLLTEHPDIDGLFCATDTIAAGAMIAIKEMGYRIPEDISVVGMGDSEIARVVSPKLTTAHYYYQTRGKGAAQMILSMLAGDSQIQRSIQLGFRLEERESV